MPKLGKLTKEEMKNLVSQGMNFQIIAEQFGVSRTAVGRLGKKYGIKSPRTRRNNGKRFMRENLRKKFLESQGWQVLKSGWPDFLKYKSINGKLILRAEEVKHDSELSLKTSGLNKQQANLITLLSRTIPIDLVHINSHGNAIKNQEFNNVINYPQDIKKLQNEIWKLKKENELLKRKAEANQIKSKQKELTLYRRLGQLAYESNFK